MLIVKLLIRTKIVATWLLIHYSPWKWMGFKKTCPSCPSPGWLWVVGEGLAPPWGGASGGWGPLEIWLLKLIWIFKKLNCSISPPYLFPGEVMHHVLCLADLNDDLLWSKFFRFQRSATSHELEDVWTFKLPTQKWGWRSGEWPWHQTYQPVVHSAPSMFILFFIFIVHYWLFFLLCYSPKWIFKTCGFLICLKHVLNFAH